MKKTYVLMGVIIILSCVFWSCAHRDPIGIEQYEVEVPTADFSIDTDLLMDGDDFSVGYYNGNIQTDQVELNWTKSTDDDFLCYKMMKMEGEPEERSMEGFESGNLPAGWTTSGDFGGWYVTDDYAYDGNFCIRTHDGYYGYEYLETTISVPQDTDIIIIFWSRAIDDGEGRFRINSNTMGYWSSSQWQQNYFIYNTGYSTSLNLEWRFDTNYYGFGLLDNIQILGAGDNFETLFTITDINSTSVIDTMLFQNSLYTYNVVAFNNSGGCQQDQLTIKTPRWEAPDDLIVNGLSAEVIELAWDDNTESEDNFTVYVWMDVNTTLELIDSTIVGKDVTSLIIDDLDTDEVYKFGVKASNSFEDDTLVGISDFFYFDDLIFDPPTDLTGYQNTGLKSVNLGWIDNSNLETGFSIERKINNGFFTQITTTEKNILEYTDNDTLYFEFGDIIIYRVRAFNDYEEIIFFTDYSNDFTITILEMSGISEDFEDGVANNWIDDGTGRWSVLNGVYRMTGNDGDDCISYYNEEITDFTYSADMIKNFGNYSLGLYFRGDGQITYGDYQNGYLFVINNDGDAYSVWRSSNGNSNSLIDWTYSNLVNQMGEVNNLKVVCEGDQMTFYINNQFLDAVTDNTFSSGFVGLWAADSGNDQDDFDNVYLTYDTDGSRKGRKVIPQKKGNIYTSEVTK